MGSIMKHALTCRSQRKIILTLYQSEKLLCIDDLTDILQCSKSNISITTTRLCANNILNCQVIKKKHYFSLTQEAKDYMVKHHPEIEPTKISIDTSEADSKENLIMSYALKTTTQRKIILTLYQSEKMLCSSDLANILQCSRANISYIINTMRADDIIQDYKVIGSRHYISLTQEARNYMLKYHPEIEPAKIPIEPFDSDLKEIEATSAENMHLVSHATGVNPELGEYCKKAIELLKFQNYRNLLINYSLKEAILISLTILCFLENKNFDLKDIAMLFGISEAKVQTVYYKGLLMLKTTINETIDNILKDIPENPQSRGSYIKQ